jgi:anti-sigma regulatory factor (Ser/Thr protein kinase)
VLHAVADRIQASTVQLHAVAMGRAHGLGVDAVDRLELVVTEMASNIVRHAGAGQVILRPIGEHGAGCIEVLALDKGPGVGNMARAMRDDGSSSGGRSRDDGSSSGGRSRDAGLAGLAAVKRIANLFDIYSHSERGTAVVAHIGEPGAGDASCCDADAIAHRYAGVVCVPLHDEVECGDAWAIHGTGGRLVAFIVDGLGHGPEAAAAARAALALFRNATTDAPELMLTSMHAALRTTRGAAISVTVVDQVRRTARFCGVGNVDGRVLTADTKQHFIPQNGIVGHTMPLVRSVDLPWPTGGCLVMHSDGISSRWRSEDYPGLLARHPALLAGVIFRDCGRARDDATVLVLRPPASSA